MFNYPVRPDRASGSSKVAAVLALSLAMVPVSAAAQDDDSAPAPIAALKACKAEADPTARLACYDRAAGEMIAASDAGDLRVVDREDVKKTRRGLFGFSLPDLGIFGRGDDEDGEDVEAIDILHTKIAGVSGSYRAGYFITTAEGAVWQLDESPRMSPKVGQEVEIRNGALSSYFLRINGQSGVKGRRIR